MTVSMKGLGQTLARELNGPAMAAGRKAADDMGKSMVDGTRQAAAAVTKARKAEQAAAESVLAAEKKLADQRSAAKRDAREIESAELKLTAAREKGSREVATAERALAEARSAGDVNKIADAESRLAEARSRTGASVLDRENALERAREKSAATTGRIAAAEQDLAAAKDKATQASENVISSTRRLDKAQSDTTGEFADARAELSRFQDELGRTGDEMLRTGEKSGGMGAKIREGLGKIGTGALLGVGAKIGSSLTAGFGTALTKGFDRLAAIDQAQAALTGLGHSAASVETIMDSAMESVKGTAFGFGDAAGLAGTLVASGIEPGRELTRILSLVGDTAAITGSDLTDMGSIWAKVAAGGRMSTEEMNQLLDRGLGILPALSEQYGVTGDEMRKMISEGKVGFDDFAQVMEGVVGGSALKMGDTFKGSLDNMGASLGRFGAKLLGPIFDNAPTVFAAISDAVDGLGERLEPVISEFSDRLAPVMASFAERVGPAITTALNHLFDALATTASVAATLVGFIRDNQTWLVPLTAAVLAATAAYKLLVLQQKIAAAGGLLAFIKNLTVATKLQTIATTAQATAQRVLNTVMRANPIMLIVTAVAVLGTALWAFFTKTENGREIWEKFTAALGRVKDFFVDIIEFGRMVGDILFRGDFKGAPFGIEEDSGLVNFLFTIRETVLGIWSGLQEGWQAYGQPVVDLIVTAFGLWWEGVQLHFRLMRAAWEVLWTGVQLAWAEFGQPLIDAVVGAFDLWSTGVGIVFGVVAAGWGLLWAGVRTVYDTVIVPVLGWVGDRLAWLGDQLGALRDRFVAGLARVGAAVRGLYDDYVRPVVDLVRMKFDEVVGVVSGLRDRVIGVLTGAGRWLYETGRNIVQGLLDGAGSLLSRLGEFFLDRLPAWVKDPFKKALGIASPSKVFASFGADIGAGLVHGVRGMAGQVADAARGLAETAATAAGEVQIAFNGGDDGYGALASLAGEDLARVAANTAADVGGVTRTAGAAVTEVGTAFAGGDDGYAATGEFLGEDAARTALDVSAQIGSAFTAVGEGVNGAKAALFDPAVAGMQQSLLDYGQVAQDQMNGVVVPVMNQAGAGIADAKARLFDPVHAGLQAAVTQTGAATQVAMLGTALPSMQTAGAGIWAVQTGTVDPALANMRGALSNTAGAFATGTTAINTEFNRVREGVAAPVRFTIGPVFNDGLVSMWNGVSDMVGLKKMTPHPINFWAGGVLPGYTPGRDPFTFVDPRTGMSIGLSGGESIMRPEWTRAIGPAGVERMNHVARTEGANGVNRMLEHRHLGGFNSGGIVGSMEAFVGKHWPSLLQNGRAFSGLRFTDNGYHSKGMAADFSNGGDAGTPEMKALANVIYRNFAGQTLELIHWPLAGFQNLWHGRPHNYSAGTNAQHRNHVHWALPAPLQAAGVALDLSGGVVSVDPRQIVESMIGDDLKRVKDLAHGFSGAGGMVDTVPGKVHDSMVKPMLDTLVKAFEEFGGDPGGADVMRWRPLAMQALARMGFSPEQYIDAMMQQIQIESGGVPNVINKWDSNWLAGHPSGGLLQVIEPTYRRIRAAYPDAFKGLPDDHLHPLTNLTAGVGAVTMDWGGPGNRWPTKLGYDQGGWLPPTPGGFGAFFNHTKAPEPVFTAEQWSLLERQLGLNVDLVEELRRLVLVINRDDDDREDLAAQAVYDVFGREPIGPDLHKVLHAGPRAWSETAAHLEHIAATGEYLQNEWFAESSQLAEAARAVNRGQVGLAKWAAASEEQGRMGTPEEFAQHYGQQVGAELLDGALGLVGLDGLIGGQWKQSIRDFAEVGGWELPGFGPTPLLDGDGRVPGTRLERVETAVAESTEAATTEAAVAVAGATQA
ncbi:tape measure protein, partial [Dietzia sp. DQ12-76]|uniref:tape measure protein n=1 Tax=Dietzia sp. DQ12-76 TaxID=1630639 RepID=UPI0019D50C79